MSRQFKTSSRMRAVQTPIIPKIADMMRATPDVISLGQGVVYYGPPDSVMQNIKQLEIKSDFHHYGPVEGDISLREGIVEKFRNENNIAIDESRSIIVTAGANMAFLNTLFAITDPGDEVILLTPFYFNHEMAVTMLNCVPVLVETDSDYQPCLDKIESAITEKTRAIVTVSPNNPTGAVYPKDILKKINALCRDKGLYHISDEAYEYFTYDETKHFSVSSLKYSSEHTISLFSFSKAYGFASWRIGYMLAPKHLSESIRKAQDTNLICPTRIAQDAAKYALREGRAYCESHLFHINEIRNEFYNALQGLGNICKVPHTKGAFYFLIKLETELGGIEIVEKLIKQHKIAAIPGEAFGLNTGCYLRIAYAALDKINAAKGIQRLIEGLTEIIGKS